MKEIICNSNRKSESILFLIYIWISRDFLEYLDIFHLCVFKDRFLETQTHRSQEKLATRTSPKHRKH